MQRQDYDIEGQGSYSRDSGYTQPTNRGYNQPPNGPYYGQQKQQQQQPLRRMKSLVRPERQTSRRYKPLVANTGTDNPNLHHANNLSRAPSHNKGTMLGIHEGEEESESKIDFWSYFVKASTCFCLDVCLISWGGLHQEPKRRAWREKVALCLIALFLCGMVGLITFGVRVILCPDSATPEFYQLNNPPSIGGMGPAVVINGQWYIFPTGNSVVGTSKAGTDLTSRFTNTIDDSGCIALGAQSLGSSGPSASSIASSYQGAVGFSWNDVLSSGNKVTFNGIVLDVASIANSTFIDANTRAAINSNIGEDVTRQLLRINGLDSNTIRCLENRFRLGQVSKEAAGCFISTTFNYTILVVVLSYVLVRAALAWVFYWFVSAKLTKTPVTKKALPQQSSVSKKSGLIPNTSRFSRIPEAGLITTPTDQGPTPTIMLVTCYSEGEASLRTTLDSMALSHYDDNRKLFFIVADGIVTGGGESRPTSEILLDMLMFSEQELKTQPNSYIAVAGGAKQHNMAKVYGGHYAVGNRFVPVILVSKCGTPDEATSAKPGNRGKRDSQIIFMNFLSKIMFDDRMTEMEYEIARKIKLITGLTADVYELVLMVDADTCVQEDALQLLVNAAVNDPSIMGLCGETRISNKTDSWVTGIQVFEYYISHHLGKAFESMFGGVTCLPGCFCTYRIKVRKGDKWLPILVNPDIVEEYSANSVDTLHKKNLLLLGEDRFLTTLMLRTFPHRKMMFIPQAVCHTVVPDTFAVLLSQRRRWINSTIHNLMELLLVKELCGIFCFSMQFVIFLELVGTAVLPAAICFTFVLIASIATSLISQAAIPLTMLLVVLFLPGLLVLTTSRKLIYIMWMLIYLIALPVWNFVLPVYAFWHFDDFSWGETRKTVGDVKGESHGDTEGEFDHSTIAMKRWNEWEKERRKTLRSTVNVVSVIQSVFK